MNIIERTEQESKHEQITKWLLPIDATTDMSGQPDNVYPFAGGIDGDQWAVVIDETQTAWSRDYGTICMLYILALQTRREHAERCPQDSIPFDGIAPAGDDRIDDLGLAEATI